MVKTENLKKQTLENWEYLLVNFQPEQIKQWTDFDKYVVGRGNENKSFCYLVEAGTKELGEIRGSNSSKFGMWYGKFGKDSNKEYRAIKRFNNDPETAFKEIKVALASLIEEAKKLTEYREIKSLLSDMFKRKIVYLFNKDCMIPSFVPEDLYYFQERLKIKVSSNFESAQLSLLKYKRENYPEFSNHDFSSYLYSTFGKNKIKETKKADKDADDELNEKVAKTEAPKEEYETHPVEKADLKQTSDGVCYYPRDPKMAAIALKKAGYKCELNNNHECFIRKSNNTPYTEVHHLIPLSNHGKFEKSLDIPENIVSLCSNCHNEIHYGKDAKKLIEKLFNERKEKLHKAGIDIELKELLKMYR